MGVGLVYRECRKAVEDVGQISADGFRASIPMKMPY